jgi:uncharacterized protein YfdQ (DUF2303 family)
MITDPNTDAAAIIEAVQSLHKMELQKLGDDVQVAVLPKGMEIRSIKPLLDEYRARPEARIGTASLQSLASFIDWTLRHKGAETVIFANNNAEAPSLTAMIDYHQEGPQVAPKFHHEQQSSDTGIPGWCRHRGHYRLALSKPWQAWAAVEGRSLTLSEMAAFIEDHITDVIQPPAQSETMPEADAKLLDLVRVLGGSLAGPSKLLELSRGISVHENAKVKNVANLSTGEVQMVFETEHTSSDGTPLRIPNMFLIAIPVFEMGAAYRMPVRLRYRRAGSEIKWIFLRHRPELYFDDAFNDVIMAARERCEVPLFLGAPEK